MNIFGCLKAGLDNSPINCKPPKNKNISKLTVFKIKILYNIAKSFNLSKFKIKKKLEKFL